MQATPTIPTLQYQHYTLRNGLEVILLEEHRLPLAAVNLWYHVGPVNERPGLTGFAHLFEHMMFEGSKHIGEKAHFRYLEAAGASSINGTTDFDRTNYFETLPSNQLELALWLESDRMGFMLDTIDGGKLENQRDVVRNERRQSIESAPYGIVHEELFHQLFPPDHPYYASVIGSHADIENARLADVQEFFQLYYAPNNASLAIIGDINPDKTKELVEKYFGPIPASRPIPRPTSMAPPITSPRRAVVEDQVELPRIYMAWITDPIYSQADADCDLIAKILGQGKSSRLYKSLVYEKRIAQDISAHQYSLALGSVFTIEATCKPEVQPEDLEKTIQEELAAFQKDGPSPNELSRARNTFESAIIRGLETLGGFGGIADRLNQYNHFLHDPGYLAKDLQRYYKADTESLRDVATTRLKREASVVVYGIPGQKIVKDAPAISHAADSSPAKSSEILGQEWRNAPPHPGPASTLQLPIPSTFKLPNGLNVFLAEQHGLPIVTANIIVLCGSDRNPPNQPGLASFTAEMLDEGTGKRSALAISSDADQIGASMATGSSMDISFAMMRTLKKNVRDAFDLISDVLLNPVFAAEEIERIRNERLTNILQQKDNPGTLATKALFDAIYSSAHPYGYLEIGTEEANRRIGRDQLVQFYQSGYYPDNSALIVAGDISESEIRELAENYFGKWKGVQSYSTAFAAAGKPERRIILIEKPGASQAVLRIGHIGVAQSHPDNVVVDVMNTAFGGLFSSRINLNLREKHGYTYGASSAFTFRRNAGPFLIGTAVHAEVAAPAIAEIFGEIERMHESQLTTEELATAKDSIVHSLPGLFETTPEVASSISQLFVHNLPLDYYRDLPEKINNISADDIQQAAQKHIRPMEAVIIAVGDRNKLEPQLEKLNLGPIEIRSQTGEKQTQ